MHDEHVIEVFRLFHVVRHAHERRCAPRPPLRQRTLGEGENTVVVSSDDGAAGNVQSRGSGVDSGPAGEGVRYSDGASAVNLDSAKSVVEAFRADKYEPEGYTLNSYAAIQAWAAAANKAGTTEGAKVAEALRAAPIPTVLGDLSFNDKGDLTKVNYAWYVWGKDGKAVQEPLN